MIAAKEITSRQVVFAVCETHIVYRSDILSFIETHIAKGSTVHTDSHPMYRGIDRFYGLLHKYDLHNRFEFHLTSEIEGVFGNLRTFIRRMYHHVRKENLPEYVVEFQCRFSRKEYFSSVEQFLLKTLRLVTIW